MYVCVFVKGIVCIYLCVVFAFISLYILFVCMNECMHLYWCVLFCICMKLCHTVYLLEQVIAGSLFEVVWATYYVDSSFGISILRAMRLLRIFKVTRSILSSRPMIISSHVAVAIVVNITFLKIMILGVVF